MNEYKINREKSTIANYTFIKEVLYETESDAIQVEIRLEALKKKSNGYFDFIHIPDYDFKRKGNELIVEQEYIRRSDNFSHFNYVHQIYNDLVLKDWTFRDMSPTNFIMSKSNKLYRVDLECFCYEPDILKRKEFWLPFNGYWMKNFDFTKHETVEFTENGIKPF